MTWLITHVEWEILTTVGLVVLSGIVVFVAWGLVTLWRAVTWHP